MKFYTYGKIVRILNYDSTSPDVTMMIDVDVEEDKVLNIFHGDNNFDLTFIKSFMRIFPSPTCGFREEEGTDKIARAMEIAKEIIKK